ncbi:MAG: HAMP domain-containing sensor histidine kinase [Bacteriovorax sp.]|jgi:signal transduction histidine kinase
MKDLLKNLDNLLPEQFSEVVGAPLLYRGRVIVATNLVSLVAVVALWAFCFVLNLSLLVQAGVFLCIATLLVHLFYLKKHVVNFERNLLIGAIAQVLVLTTVIYLTAFSAKGMGFFGLIWLIPVFLMIALYFNTRFSFYFALINFAIYSIISYFVFHRFFTPMNVLPNFPKIFFVFLTLVIAFAYMLALLFVHLSEELQREVLKQRDLLVESAKFQSLGQMASNLAHDINNPLFTIQGKLHQMRNLLSRDQLDLERCDQIVESVEATLLRLSQIVKGISTFAREGRGDQMVSINISELIENNLAFAMDRIKNSGIEVEIQIEPEARIICYPSFISQVLLNLLNNAIDALEIAPIKVISVRAYREKNWINIIISDTGTGVPKDCESKIFEPFFTTKTLGKGTGLGLSISKGLVEVHEGELSYERQGQKTIFLVRLPSYD